MLTSAQNRQLLRRAGPAADQRNPLSIHDKDHEPCPFAIQSFSLFLFGRVFYVNPGVGLAAAGGQMLIDKSGRTEETDLEGNANALQGAARSASSLTDCVEPALTKP